MVGGANGLVTTHGAWEAWFARAGRGRRVAQCPELPAAEVEGPGEMSGAAKRADQGGRRGAWGVVRAVAVRYPVGSFVVLAFVVSWTAWGPLLADR